MSKRWLTALLLISFSFNLAVVGSFIYLRLVMPCPVPPPERLDRQMQPMHREHGYMANDPEVNVLRRKFTDTKIKLMQELAKNPVDESKVNAIIDSSLYCQNDLEHKLGLKILAYRKTMNAAEAKEHFLRRAENLKNRTHNNPRIRLRRKP
ncbi:MAG: hypothetical protein RBS43_06305 [Candidatus Cloacimonas sp.]|nr:hypothetical protein [Candidatus Cloacimonas sp.]